MWPFKKRNKKPVFLIQEYPLTRTFFVWRQWHGYLSRDHYTGFVKTEQDIYYATRCKSLQEAELLIAQYKEQKFKKTVITQIRN